MAKTKEEKAQYCREWRAKNRERYLATKRAYYHKNKEGYRDAAKERASRYYNEVLKPKREANPEFYRKLDRQAAQKKVEKKRKHLRELRERLGGKCSKCGYDETVDILQFHHHNDDKYMAVCEIQNYMKREKEASKCILLCPNCHALEHLC